MNNENKNNKHRIKWNTVLIIEFFQQECHQPTTPTCTIVLLNTTGTWPPQNQHTTPPHSATKSSLPTRCSWRRSIDRRRKSFPGKWTSWWGKTTILLRSPTTPQSLQTTLPLQGISLHARTSSTRTKEAATSTRSSIRPPTWRGLLRTRCKLVRNLIKKKTSKFKTCECKKK